MSRSLQEAKSGGSQARRVSSPIESGAGWRLVAGSSTLSLETCLETSHLQAQLALNTTISTLPTHLGSRSRFENLVNCMVARSKELLRNTPAHAR